MMAPSLFKGTWKPKIPSERRDFSFFQFYPLQKIPGPELEDTRLFVGLCRIIWQWHGWRLCQWILFLSKTGFFCLFVFVGIPDVFLQIWIQVGIETFGLHFCVPLLPYSTSANVQCANKRLATKTNSHFTYCKNPTTCAAPVRNVRFIRHRPNQHQISCHPDRKKWDVKFTDCC